MIAYEKDIKGWEESVDLSKENKDKLQQEVEEFYKSMIKIYESKDVNALAGKYYNRQKEQAQAFFSNQPENTKQIIDEWVKDANDKRPFIFNNYVMRFFANGKIVQLADMDKYYYNASVLKREDKDGNYTEYVMFLHRPKVGEPLEVIR